MDLTLIPGIGPDERGRLAEAGVPDVAALARAPHLAALAERSGIPAPHLAAFQATAQDLTEESGISMTAPAPFQEVAQTLWRAAEDARIVAAYRVERARVAVGGTWGRARAQVDRALALAAGTAAAGLREVRRGVAGARSRVVRPS